MQEEINKAIEELRTMWPRCSYEIVFYTYAGFSKDFTQHVEIGVISDDYQVRERWSEKTLDNAMILVRQHFQRTPKKRL